MAGSLPTNNGGPIGRIYFFHNSFNEFSLLGKSAFGFEAGRNVEVTLTAGTNVTAYIICATGGADDNCHRDLDVRTDLVWRTQPFSTPCRLTGGRGRI